MKRIICIVLAAGLLLLAGCSGGAGEDTADGASGSGQPGTSSAASGAGTSGGAGTSSGTASAGAQSQIPGIKAGIYFGMTKAELDAMEPNMELDETMEEENWCAFETVGGTPLYDFAHPKGIDVVNSYTIIEGKVALVEVLANSNQITPSVFEDLADAYGELYGADVNVYEDETEIGMASYTCAMATEDVKLEMELLTDIPEEMNRENYLCLRFTPL